MTLSFWVLTYLVLTVGIGMLAARRIHSSVDFIAAGRRLPMFLNASALFALWFGSETVIGASSEFIQHGILGVIEDPFGGFLCLILFAVFLVRRLYNMNLLTLGDLFRNVYGPRVERLATVVMILTFFSYAAAQIIALGILFQTVFGLDVVQAKLVSAVIVTLYTATGGMWSVSITDFMQSVVIVIGLLLITWHVGQFIHTESLFTAPQPHFFDVVPTKANQHSWLDYLAAWSALSLGSLASQDIFQRANAAKSAKVAVQSTYLGAFLYLVFALFPLLLGLMLLQLDPSLAADNQQHALMELVARYTPFWLQVIFYGALISAIFSTCSGALLAPASLLAENLIRPVMKQPMNDNKFLFVSRLSVFIIAAIMTALALVSESIYALVSQASILGMVSILVPFLAAIYLPQRQHPLGALLSMLLGLASYGILELGSVSTPIPSMFIGLAASALGLWLGNRLASSKMS